MSQKKVNDSNIVSMHLRSFNTSRLQIFKMVHMN